MNPIRELDNRKKLLISGHSRAIIFMTLIILILSSGEAGIRARDNNPTDLMVTISGIRDGNENEVTVLLINASNESTPIFHEIISGNATYDLTGEGENETDPATWGDYDILVWAQGREDRNASLESELRDYVINGGHLLIEGANLAEHAGSSDFEEDVLHASSVDGSPPFPLNNYVGQNLTKYEADHPVASDPNNLSDPISYRSNESSRLDSDVCEVENSSVVVLEWEEITTVNDSTDENSANYGGVFAFDDDSNLSNGGQIVFFSFGVELVNNSSDREELIENSLQWIIPMEMEEYYSFYLSPDYQEKTTTSGGTTVYEIRVHNNGTEDDTIDLVRSAPPSGWHAQLNRSSVTVNAGEDTAVSLTVNAPVNATNGENANISVYATSQGDPDLDYSVYTNTTVNNEARADLEPIRLGPLDNAMVLGEDTTINATVRNNGDRDAENVVVNFYLDQNSTGHIGTDVIDVPAGEEREASIDWNATSSFGDHVLIVEVEYTESEHNESNNHLENATGDWIVRGIVDWSDAEYNLTGNLSVEGRFLLENVSIYFNSTDGKYTLDCMSPGGIEANASVFGPLGNASDSTFRFEVRGELILTNSFVYKLHYESDLMNPIGGIVIFSSMVLIRNTTITDSGMGIWTSVSPRIINSTFENLTDYGLYSTSGSPRVTGSVFRNLTNGIATAIALKGGAGMIMECEITNVSTGIFSSHSSNAFITGNMIHDLNGLKRGVFISKASPVVERNEIHKADTGIWIENDASPTILRNDLSDNDHYSVYSMDSTPTLEENIMSGNRDHGVSLNGGEVIIKHCIISDNENRGIYAYMNTLLLDNITFERNKEGIYAYKSCVELYNSTFAFNELDLNLTRSTTLLLINSTFDYKDISSDSTLSLGWFLNLKAVDRDDQPVAGADVRIKDNSGTLVFEARTDSNGEALFMPLVSYNITGDSETWFTPHRVDVDYHGGNWNDTMNLTESLSIEIMVNMAPVAVLKSNLKKGTPETLFRFYGDDSTDDSGKISVYNFDFGDGESTGWIGNDGATHTYEDADDYTVTLLVKDIEGAISEPATLSIRVNNPPVVNLPEIMRGKEGVSLTFDADVYDPDAWDNLHYHWDFDDGNTSHMISPSHTYESTGDYTVKLIVTDDHGGEGEDTMDVEIGENTPPVADAGDYINATFNNGAYVRFTSYSYDEDGDTLTYFWDFGDNTTSLQENPTHYYNRSGTFNATLTVEDTSGDTDTDTVEVNVIEYRVEFTDSQTTKGKREEKIWPSITVKNAGTHTSLINLSTPEISWIIIPYQNITVGSGNSKKITLTVNIPKNAQIGTNELTLIAEAGGKEFEGSILVDVTRDYGVSFQSPSSQNGNPGKTLIFDVTLINTGDDEDSFEVIATDFPPGWNITLNNGITALLSEVPAGRSANILLSFQIPQEEEAGEKTIILKASSISDLSSTDTVTIRITVNKIGGDDSDSESSNIFVYALSFIILLTLIMGGFLYWKRGQSLQFAEEEEDEEDEEEEDMPLFGDWEAAEEKEEKKKKEEKLKKMEKKEMEEKPKPRILKCPKCETLLEVPTTKRPITIQCPTCGARAHVKK